MTTSATAPPSAFAPVVMPKLGLTMTEGIVAEWIARVGQRVAPGDVLLVVETEKTTTDVEATAGGVLDEILVPAGERVAVGTVLARLRPDGVGRDAATPVAPERHATAAPSRIVATPLARRIARERSIDLGSVRGSGPGGRIKAGDVLALPRAGPLTSATAPAAAAAAATAPARAPAASAATVPGAHDTIVVPSPFHLAMARRVARAKREIPHFYVSAEAEVGFLLEYRRKLNEVPGRRRVSINHLVVKAVGQALRDDPAANVVWRDEHLVRLASTDVGIAIETERGVAVAVVRDAGSLSLGELAERADALADQARRGRLREEDVTGGAISVSNVGMHGATYLAPIIQPEQSAILGVGAIRELFRPGPDGSPRLHREMGLVLACDHRVHDGVSALRFLNAVIALLHNPLRLGAT